MKEKSIGQTLANRWNRPDIPVEFHEGELARPDIENVLKLVLKKQGRAPKWLPGYDGVVDWIADTKGKGLIITGNVGTGKSLFARYVIPYCIHYRLKQFIPVFQATDMLDAAAWKKMLWYRLKVVDDIGTEKPEPYSGVEKFAELMAQAERNNEFLILTTNLTGDQIKTRYGLRTYDRVKFQCTPVAFYSEKSLRQ